MSLAPNALYDSKPAPLGAECEWKRCGDFAPNGADIDSGAAGAINISLLTERKRGTFTLPATSLYHSIAPDTPADNVPCATLSPS